MRRISPTKFRVATRGITREINRQIVLNLIRAKQPVSRADLARLMGVRRGSISRLVSELLQSGRIYEGAKGDTERGRKPTHLYIDTRRTFALAVDIGASSTAILPTDLLGHPLLDVAVFATDRRPPALIRQLAKRLRRTLGEHPHLGTCIGIGVAMSGLVGLDGGLTFSPTLGWRDIDLVEPLQEATGLPVIVENSCKACVLAQVWSLRGDVPVDGPLAFINVSDGVGVGVAVDGKLLRGANNIAGEFGHLPLDTHGPRCSCGQRGCWEAYVSRRAVIARYLGTDPAWSAIPPKVDITIEEILARARGGDRRAIRTLHSTAAYLGRGMATIIKAVDPRRVYLGGELTAVWDLIEPGVRRAMRTHALVPEAGETEILTVALGDTPRLRGAAALVSSPSFAAPVVA